MTPAPDTPVDKVAEAEHTRQVQEQAKIADEVAAAEAPESEAEAAPAEAAKTVTLQTVNVDEYPVYVSVVGSEDELYFPDSAATVSVTPEVAEQTTYIPIVEVVS